MRIRWRRISCRSAESREPADSLWPVAGSLQPVAGSRDRGNGFVDADFNRRLERMGAGFAATDRFLAAVKENRLRAGYVLVGDDLFLYERCRRAVLDALVPADLRDFCLSEIDLAETNIFEALDRAQTPSLMAPFQVLFIRNLKQLYTRGAKKEEFAALEAYFRSPNPQALVLFVADHLRIPSDPRRMDLQDKDRYERIRETLGDWCGLVELARVDEADALKWIASEAKQREVTIEADAARELADALGADMM